MKEIDKRHDLSLEVKDLICWMLEFYTMHRPTAADVLQHPWFKGRKLKRQRNGSTIFLSKTFGDKMASEQTEDSEIDQSAEDNISALRRYHKRRRQQKATKQRKSKTGNLP